MLSVSPGSPHQLDPYISMTRGLTVGSPWRGKIVIDRCPGPKDGALRRADSGCGRALRAKRRRRTKCA
jgi:hypothetical protein